MEGEAFSVNSCLHLPFRCSLGYPFLTAHDITQLGQGPMDPLFLSISCLYKKFHRHAALFL
jgi:hypothetical protein